MFRDWQARLTVCFYEREAKNACSRDVRKAIAAQVTQRSSVEVEALQQAVIARLVGLASQEARLPQEPDEPSPFTFSRQEIENLVVKQFPYPIAACYLRLTQATSPSGAFGALLDTFESLLYYLTTVVLSAYWREGACDAEHNKRLLGKLFKGKWGPGDLVELLRETTRLYLGPGALPYPLGSYLFKPNGQRTSSLA